MAWRDYRMMGVPQGVVVVNDAYSHPQLKMINDGQPLPVDLVTLFWFYLRDGILPSGQSTTRNRIDPEQSVLFATPYAEWAPAPYNTSELRGDSALNRSTMSISGLNDIFSMVALTSTFLDKDLHNMKTRLWAGMPPMSDSRWRQKRLHEPANIKQACQHICVVVDAFDYIHLAHSQKRLRGAWNGTWDACYFFERALNAKRSSQGQSPVSVTGLWEDFMVDYLKTISNRAHSWALKYLDELRETQYQLLATTAHELGPRSYSDEQMAILDIIHDLVETTVKADGKIMIPLHGFKIDSVTYVAPSPILDWTLYNGSTPVKHWPWHASTRVTAYGKRCKHLSRAEGLRQAMESIQLGQNTGATSSPEDLIMTSRTQVNEFKKARLELRGPPQVFEDEMWISVLKQRLASRYQAWGYVAYRLCYSHSDEQWQAFLRRFKEKVTSWGEGVHGAPSIKPLCRIRWIDGREHGIAEGDIEAAKRHYLQYEESPACETLLTTGASTFLVADEDAVNSFMSPLDLGNLTLVAECDMEPFILAATADKPDPPTSDATPGFDGTVRVSGSVLFDDLWAGLLRRTVQLKNLWPLAAVHPRLMYVGPSVPTERATWSKCGVLCQTVLTTFHNRQGERS